MTLDEARRVFQAWQQYVEIADKLSISHKTVENQLTIALKHLRKSLGEFMLLVLFLI